jgi:thiol-disulfide isomerase/thioredoxin
MRYPFLAFLVTVSIGVAAARAAQVPQTTPPPVRSPGQILIAAVRAAIARRDFGGAQSLVDQSISTAGNTPEALEALSWIARGELAAEDYSKASQAAERTEKLVVDVLKTRPLDAETHLPIALGAAIETEAKVMVANGQRASAIVLLQDQVKRYANTSIRPRLQKNINLLTLEGKRAPAFTATEFLGAPMPKLRGRPTLLFFWAHWCPDCKAEAPIVADLMKTYAPLGLQIVGPTQRYGYVAGSASAPPDVELKYIEQVRQQYYAAIDGMAVPVSNNDCLAWGMDATPTMALVDRNGIVTLYHPGKMTRAELEPYLKAVLAPRSTTRSQDR